MFIKYIVETFLILADFGLFALILTFYIPMARAFAFISIMLILNVFVYYLLRLWIDKTIQLNRTKRRAVVKGYPLSGLGFQGR